MINHSSLLQPLYQVLYYLIPAILIAGLLKTPWFKGLLGEFLVNLSSKFLLDKNTYRLLKNVTLSTPDGTTQIDHILVSVFGVFVIETKNMKGWIFGDPKQSMWTQKIFKASHTFQNPLHQNYKHIKTLEAFLNIPAETLHSVICFAGDCQLKTPMPDNVTQGGGYAKHIRTFKTPVFSDEEVNHFVESIQFGRLSPSLATHRAHVAHVKAIKEEKLSRRVSPNCPKCGTPMVMRQAKSGANAGKEFWGCPAFPQCKSILPVRELS